jgi:hypothetical protein
MSFKDKLDKHKELHQSIVTTFEEFVEWLCGIPDNNDLGIDYLKWSKSYGETYKEHCYSGDEVCIELEYQDPYEDYKSYSNIIVPIDWIDCYINRDEDHESFRLLGHEVIRQYIEYADSMKQSEIDKLKRQAYNMGYVLTELDDYR